MDLSFIIPAYNEESRIERSLLAALDYFEDVPYSWEIIVVDDGSGDATVDRVKTFAGKGVRVLEQPKNMGKGAAGEAWHVGGDRKSTALLRRGLLDSGRGDRTCHGAARGV